MNLPRINTEIAALRQHYTVAVNLKNEFPYVIVKDFDFGPDWRPRTGDVMLVLRSSHPQKQPVVLVEDHMEYLRGPTKHWMSKLPAPRSIPNHRDWKRWCIHELNWNPNRHTLISIMRLMDRAFRKPNSDHTFDKVVR